MVFSSLIFVFLFLTVCYTVYTFGRTIKAKNIILLISSLIFYAWGGPALVLLLCLMAFVCWGGAIVIERAYGNALKKSLCWATVLICLSILFIFKYTGFVLSQAFSLFNIDGIVPSIALPIGISFYTFQLVSYVIDVYRGDVEAQKKYWILLLYASLFHQCIAGPIVRYADVNDDIHNRVMTREETSRGISRFAIGLAKKSILANGCGAICDSIFNDASGILLSNDKLAELSSVAIIIGIFCYTLQLYLDFSAYSDMAIGMGLMIGFHYKENFNYPYTAVSITDFWRRWHISLSSFFRDYVYIPLGGNRVRIPRHILNMLTVWLLTGFWHGANWNFVLWGLYYFVFLVIEKYLLKLNPNPKGIIRIIRIIPTFIIVFFASILFKFTDMSAIVKVFFGIFLDNGNAFIDAQTQMLLINNVFFLVACCVACTPVIPTLARIFEKRDATRKIWVAAGAVIPAILVILSACALAGDSYNPFMYFQF